MINLCYLTHVFHGNRLPAPGIIGDGNHTQWDILRAGLADEVAQFLHIHITFERMAVGRFVGFIYDQVNWFAAPGKDIRLGGVEVHIGRDALAWFDQ